MADQRVLLTALNWGLGHATRCIPIIRELEKQGAQVFLGSDGQSLELLREEFPKLKAFELPAYAPKYGSKRSFELEMALQIPKFLSAIRQEEKVCAELCRKHRIDRIISDNRWGCAPDGSRAVFMTHQLFVKLNGVMRIAESSLLSLQNRMLKNFETVWVPDWEGRHSLSGELSHGNKKKKDKFPLPVEFIGPLSRLSATSSSSSQEKKYDLMVLLSGPEPQRSHFEETLLKQCKQVGKKGSKILFVRGSKEVQDSLQNKLRKSASQKASKQTVKTKEFKNIELKHRINSAEVASAIQDSKIVIARSGYSSIMDFCKMQANCILIPTPGQTEQEYLAQRLSKKGFCITANQNDFQLEALMDELGGLKGFPKLAKDSALTNAVANFLAN